MNTHTENESTTATIPTLAEFAAQVTGQTYVDPDWVPGMNPWQGPLVSIGGEVHELGRGCSPARLQDLLVALEEGRTEYETLESCVALRIVGERPERLYVYRVGASRATGGAPRRVARPEPTSCPVGRCFYAHPAAVACEDF